jgi:hypothetical protein
LVDRIRIIERGENGSLELNEFAAAPAATSASLVCEIQLTGAARG